MPVTRSMAMTDCAIGINVEHDKRLHHSPRKQLQAMRHTCGCDGEDAVGVDIKLDLNLRDATGCWGNAIQAEVAQRLVVPYKLTLACATTCEINAEPPLRF